MNIKNIFLGFTLIGTISCTSASSDEIVLEESIPTKTIEHYNIIFAPDLSNRIISSTHPKPVNDIQIINDFLNDSETILTYKRTQNQYDRYSFDFINKNLISRFNVNLDVMKLDFSVFDNRQIDRIEYLKNKSDKKFSNDLARFEEELKRVYESARSDNYGADIYSYLNSLSQQSLGKQLGEFEYQKVNYKGLYKNVLLLFTDGYIEAGLYGKDGCKSGNQCYYLSSNKITEFRNAFQKSGEDNIEAFFAKSDYRLVPISNDVLKEFDVLVLEVNDRSLDVAVNASVHPTDFQILKLFWSDWLSKSGVEKFEILPVASSRDLAQKNILKFLEIK
jgi:hypothetical protein